MLLTLSVVAALLTGAAELPDKPKQERKMYPALEEYVAARVAEFDQIDAERRAALRAVAAYVLKCRLAKETARLNFICTHNSRRSHLSQVFATVGARHFGIERVETFSGGTEATAFNPRAIAALRRAGLKIERTTGEQNPVYHVRTGPECTPLTCFSKIYNQAPNPSSDFCAVMTCDDADEKCPLVQGATERVAVTYVDPKVSDDTDKEAATYDARARQIAREMLFVFSEVANKLRSDERGSRVQSPE